MGRSPRLLARLLRLKPGWNRDLFVFLHLVRAGETVLDVGANVGLYTESFARIVGRRGRVRAFEPVPDTFARLQTRFAGPARWPQVSLHHAAVCDRDGPVTLHLPGDDSGQAAMRPHHIASWETGAVRTFTCAGSRLDDLPIGEEAPVLVKLDVEGAELAALRGARDLLRRHQPALYVEVWDMWARDFGYTPADLAREWRELGYDRFLAVTERFTPLPDLEASWSPLLAAGPHNVLVWSSRSPVAGRAAAIARG